MKFRPWLTAALLPFLGGLLAQAAEPRIGKYTRYDAGEFEIITSRSASQARALVNNLAKFRVALETTLQRRATGNAARTLIVICGNADWKRFLQPRPEIAGFFQRADFSNYMAIDGEASFDLAQVVVFHEYTHYFLASRFAGEYPPWFNEGLAELMAYAQFGKGRVVMRLPGYHLDEMRRANWIPFDRLIRVDHHDAEYQTHTLASSFYAESWLTVHYGMVENREFGKQMFDYLNQVNALVPHDEAVSKTFGDDLSVQDKLLRGYSRLNRMASGAVNIPDVAPVTLTAGTPVEPTDAMAILADVMLESRIAPDRIRPLIESLERTDANAARSATLAARLARATDDNAAFEKAVARAEGALAAGDWTQRRELASVLLQNGLEMNLLSTRSDDDRKRDVQRAVRIFAEAVQHNNEDVEALWGFGAAATHLEQNLDLAEQALFAAYKRDPANAQIASTLATLKARQQKPDEMIPFLNDVIRFSTSREMRRWAAETIVETQSYIAERERRAAEDRKRREEYEKQLADYEKKYGKNRKKK